MLIMLGFLGCMSPSGAEIVTADAQDIARVGVPAGDCLLPKPSQLMLMMLRLRRCPSVLVWNLSQLMLTMLALSGCLPVSPEIVVKLMIVVLPGQPHAADGVTASQLLQLLVIKKSLLVLVQCRPVDTILVSRNFVG
ncbi:hypothetical protein AK812_SmicGene8922 [Symbiodinium microadriaticum]|uniref:Secreted protein n=1 Tax=Symbiodinium microadriaticum TaxID=2951 RepID=A0A1Q9EJU4_SYMMI|nr:hypothetical protein AK812_SmicGene8922 [Symbiodinium microadriaticum]